MLLTLLVLTGFAGKIHNETLTGKERRQLINELKSSRASLAESIEGLSDKQFAFVSLSHSVSIRDCISHLAKIENSLRSRSSSMTSRAPHSCSSGTDRELAELAELLYCQSASPSRPHASADINDLLSEFRDDRQAMVRYVKNTTSNLHEYTVRTEDREMDIYQLLSLNARHTELCVQLIEAIKRSPGFPKR